MRAALTRFNGPGALFLAGLLLAWEIAGQLAASPNGPPFSAVLANFAVNLPILTAEAMHTLGRALAGLLLAIVTMVPLGILLGRIRAIGDVIEPVIDLLRPLPPIAVIPIAMIFAGTGSAAKIMVVFYGCMFPIVINTIDAVRGTHPMYLRVARSFGLGRGEVMRLVDMPAALPQIMTGIRISVSISLLISVSSEMLLSTNGLGNFIVRAQERFQIAEGIAGLLTIALLGLAVNALYLSFDRWLLRWHYGVTGGTR